MYMKKIMIRKRPELVHKTFRYRGGMVGAPGDLCSDIKTRRWEGDGMTVVRLQQAAGPLR